MDYVDLRRRREDHARRKPEAARRSAARDPLFLLIVGFASGSLASFFLAGFLGYPGPTPFLFLTVIPPLVLLLYVVWRLSGRGAERSPARLGSEKQLLMAIWGADGGITPVEAALETSLTVDEAEEILTSFANRGHLVVRSRDGCPPLHAPGRAPRLEAGSCLEHEKPKPPEIRTPKPYVCREGPIPSSKTRRMPESSSPPKPREEPVS